MTATPERIVDIAIGFMGAKQLDAASRIGLFKSLAGGPKNLAEIVEATKCQERQVRTLADAMNGLGLLERQGGNYSLAADSAKYLSGEGGIDLTPFISFLGDISYKQWLGYDHTVDTDEAGTLDLDEAGWGDFMNGVMTYNDLHAEQYGQAFKFDGYKSLLDFGGLAAGFAITAMTQNTGLTTRFVYAPGFGDGIGEAAKTAGVADRIEIDEEATETAKPAGEHDLVLLGGVLHRFTEEQNQAILQAARDAATPGATLHIIDFFLDHDGAQRSIDALHAGEYFNIDGTVVYGVEQVTEWLEGAGWKFDRLVALPGSPRVLVATAA